MDLTASKSRPVAGLNVSGAGRSDCAIKEMAKYKNVVSNRNDKCISKIRNGY